MKLARENCKILPEKQLKQKEVGVAQELKYLPSKHEALRKTQYHQNKINKQIKYR
jgi:hypothetical protein